ncbi:PhnB protein [Mucinivorans hirudinis]|uniref:PhnB protein n=1 Tax=Mucinivorans hirudinis TaxID=1433126 RepID=A0A060R6S7_9BACT|nr:PhnB protein [Mucinivorans hirudinis]
MKIKPYLIFNGNAEEAANRYAEILGGRIENLNRYGDCMPNVPEEYKNKIAHICFFVGDEVMGMADSEPGTATTFGTGNIITLHYDNEEQIKDAYEKLSVGGVTRLPLQPTFFAKQYAELTDCYGVAWCLIIE